MSPPFLGAPVVLDMFQGPRNGRYIQGKNCPSGSFAKSLMPYHPLFNRPAHLDDLDWLRRQWYKDTVFKSSSWVPSTSSILLIVLWIYCIHLLLLWRDILYEVCCEWHQNKIEKEKISASPKNEDESKKKGKGRWVGLSSGSLLRANQSQTSALPRQPAKPRVSGGSFLFIFLTIPANFEMIIPFAGWQYRWWPRSWWFPWATHPLLRLASVNCLLKEEGKPNMHWALQIRFSSRTYIRHYTVSIVSGCRCF